MQRTFFNNFIFNPRFRLLRHLAGLLFYFIIIVGLDSNDKGGNRIPIYLFLFFMPVVLLFANLVIYWLIPSFLLKKKYIVFLLLYCSLTVVCLTLIFFDANYIYGPFIGVEPKEYSWFEIYKHIFSLADFLEMHIYTMLCIFFKLFKFWYIEHHQKQLAEEEKMKAELALLKAQFHPHFLFNTLNNLYSLVYEKSEKAPVMLMRLSGILSYVLYECNADEVLLSRQIEVIKDYVLLEKERYGDRLEISSNFSGDIENVMIAPMLFQPFIENGFKHGTSEQLGKVWMSIDLSVKHDQLYFKVINSFDNHPAVSPNESGIGIENVRKRLDFLYPGRYHLQFGPEEDVYFVSLEIKLIVHLENELFEKNDPLLKPSL